MTKVETQTHTRLMTEDAVDTGRRFALPVVGAMALAAATSTGARAQGRSATAPAVQLGLEPNAASDQSARLQAAIDQAAARGVALQLPAGKIIAGGIKLRPGSHLVGAAGAGTVLSPTGAGVILSGTDAPGLVLDGLTFDGAHLPMPAQQAEALLQLEQCRDVTLQRLTVRNAARGGIKLVGVSGRVEGCHLSGIATAALWSVDANGLVIAHNTIADCANNGILVWRSRHGEDGTIIAHNRISRIRAAAGGTGQNGNAVNTYRAARVQIMHNMITDCAYSAVRANESSNVQMLGNSAARIGEVAFYAEAAAEHAGAPGFEGAILSSNVVDDAATGLVVTNFNNGGRLAVVQGNLVRNLRRREHEPVDKRGEGIAVEADAVVANNVIENAPTCGILIGWGKYMREVVASGNLIRRSRIGIAVTGDAAAGQCLLAQNMITSAKDGAIRAMDRAIPLGGDLAAAGAKLPRHITVVGNAVS